MIIWHKVDFGTSSANLTIKECVVLLKMCIKYLLYSKRAGGTESAAFKRLRSSTVLFDFLFNQFYKKYVGLEV